MPSPEQVSSGAVAPTEQRDSLGHATVPLPPVIEGQQTYYSKFRGAVGSEGYLEPFLMHIEERLQKFGGDCSSEVAGLRPRFTQATAANFPQEKVATNHVMATTAVDRDSQASSTIREVAAFADHERVPFYNKKLSEEFPGVAIPRHVLVELAYSEEVLHQNRHRWQADLYNRGPDNYSKRWGNDEDGDYRFDRPPSISAACNSEPLKQLVDTQVTKKDKPDDAVVRQSGDLLEKDAKEFAQSFMDRFVADKKNFAVDDKGRLQFADPNPYLFYTLTDPRYNDSSAQGVQFVAGQIADKQVR